MAAQHSDSGAEHLLTRRQVLRGGGLLLAGVAGAQYASLGRAAAAVPDFAQPGSGPGQHPSHVVTVRRRDDLLDLRFECWNLVVSDHDGVRRLVRRNPGAAYLVVVFPPQALGERAWMHDEDPEQFSLPFGAWPAGESRLAFEVPPDVSYIDYTLGALLSWTALHPRLVPVAKGSPDPVPPGQEAAGPVHPQLRAPHSNETALEIPWRLFLSPHAGLGWAHAIQPVTHNGRTEIWHTRLGVRDGAAVDEWTAAGRTIQAVWAPKWQPVFDGQNFLSSDDPKTPLEQKHRDRIVQATSNYALEGRAPADVHRLMLTPLGGWLDVHGTWDIDWDIDEDTDDFALIEWRHQATMGRDHYVRVVEKGRLFPYGHRAVKVTDTERKFEKLFGAAGALLRKREYVVVLEPVRAYPALGQRHEGREWPFGRLGFTTLATPDLSGEPTSGQVLEVDGATFLFEVWAEDLEGRRADFSTPAVFIGEDAAKNPMRTKAAADVWNGDDATTDRDLSGQKVALAPPSQAGAGDTTLDVSTLRIAADELAVLSAAELAEAGQPHFYPKVAQVTAHLGDLEQLSGGAADEPTYTLYELYVSSGFDQSNPAGVFLETLTEAAVAVATDRAGGLTAPAFPLTGLARELGPVGGALADIATGTFDPEQVFTDTLSTALPKLLGTINLADIVAGGNFLNGRPDSALRIKTTPVGDPTNPEALRTELTWEPDLLAGPGDADVAQLIEPGPGSTMRIAAVFVQALQGGESTYDVHGRLGAFTLNLIGVGATQFMRVHVDGLQFRTSTGAKAKLMPAIGGVEFAGPLEFINKIREYLSFGGAEPDLRLSAEGVTVGVGLQIPSIPLGQVMINDIALSGSLTIPFNGDPARLRFGLSSRENPFSITYSAIGGGGFFAIGFDLRGLEGFEFAGELGAYLPMDFGIVSGSISLAAGIYFELKMGNPESVELTAYIRFNGSVSFLGLVSLSLELYLGLGFEYVDEQPKLVGEARATFKIKVVIFSGKIEVKVRRTLGSTPKTFAQLYSPEDWHAYTAAFA